MSQWVISVRGLACTPSVMEIQWSDEWIDEKPRKFFGKWVSSAVNRLRLMSQSSDHAPERVQVGAAYEQYRSQKPLPS